MPQFSAFHSEAPRATAPAVPGAAKLTVPPAGMGAAVVRRDSIGFEVRFYFRAYICTHMIGWCICCTTQHRNAGLADRDGPVVPADRGSASDALSDAVRRIVGRCRLGGQQPPPRPTKMEAEPRWPMRFKGGATSPSPQPPCAHRIAAHGACVLILS